MSPHGGFFNSGTVGGSGEDINIIPGNIMTSC